MLTSRQKQQLTLLACAVVAVIFGVFFLVLGPRQPILFQSSFYVVGGAFWLVAIILVAVLLGRRG